MNTTHEDWFGPDAATFGDRMAGAREQAGISQAQLARRLGVKKATVIAWEEDRSDPRANKLSMMAGLLNASIMWLLTGEGDGPEAPDIEAGQAVNLAGIAAEMRALRAEMRHSTERAARLEKRIRALGREATE